MKNSHLLPHLQPAAIPLTLAAVLTSVALVWEVLDLPDIPTLMVALRQWYNIYGLPLVFVTGFIEAIFMVGIYLPCSLAIFIAILLYADQPSMLILITAMCWLSFMAAMVVNYYLGAQGFYRLFNALGAKRLVSEMQIFLTRHGRWAFLITAFHPNYLGITAVCAGIARQGLLRTLFWCGLGMAISGPVLVFSFALFIDKVVTPSGHALLYYGFIGLLLAWSALTIGQNYIKQKSS